MLKVETTVMTRIETTVPFEPEERVLELPDQFATTKGLESDYKLHSADET